MLKLKSLNILSRPDFVRILDELLQGPKETTAYSFVNPYSFYCLLDHEEYGDLDGVFSDGILLTKLLRFKYKANLERLSFDFGSIADEVFAFSEKNKLRVAVIGASSAEILYAIENIKEKYPNLIISFSRHGYCLIDNFDSVCSSVLRNQTDILVLGLGAPLQEKAALMFKDKNAAKLIFTCGGFLTQTAISTAYYPILINKLNLRWLYRLIKHQHVRNKFFSTYPSFLMRFFLEISSK